MKRTDKYLILSITDLKNGSIHLFNVEFDKNLLMVLLKNIAEYFKNYARVIKKFSIF